VDLWQFKTQDGRSIRVALDSLVPFGVGEQKWPHQQIAAIESRSLLIPLRRAESAYRDVNYESAIAKLKLDLPTDRDNLRFPAITATAR
jgi:hypothetical protein